MPKLIICRGIQASGKTTWATSWVSESPETRVRVNRDDIRFMLFGKYHGVPEDVVTRVQESIMVSAMQAGQDVVLDNTNLNSKYVRRILDTASHYDYEVEVQDFPVDVEEAVLRDARRATLGRSVGEAVVRDFYRRYMRNGEFPKFPTYVKPDNWFKPYSPDNTLKKAYLFDIDGTLAHIDATNPRDVYDASRAHEDILDEHVYNILDLIVDAGIEVIIMSGRSEDHRAETERWLDDKLIGYAGLFMRPSGDVRKDSIVKHELFYSHVAPNHCVLGVFDDRNQVVDMWRAIGLKCFQVQDGDF